MSEPQKKMRNIVLIGATGNGKSSTANSIVSHFQNLPPNTNLFAVSDGVLSCTNQFQVIEVPKINAKLIDSPGFGDTNYDEKYIDELLRSLTNRVVSVKQNSTGAIDAFILIAKLSPRPATLKADLQHLRSVFGSISFKSVIVLVIDSTEPARPAEEIYQDLETGCKELLKPLLDQKLGAPIRDWILYWDNKKPREGQFEALMKMTEKVEQYTHQKFLDAQKEIKDAIDLRIKEEVEVQKKALETKFANDKATMQAEITKMQQAKEVEKQQFLTKQQSLENAVQDAMKKMQEAQQAQQTAIADMTKKAEEANKQHQDQMNQMNQQHQEQMNNMQNQLTEALSKPPQIIYDGGDDGGICNLI